MGVNATIGNFEKYVKSFIDSTKYPVTDVITYAATGAYGVNLLDSSVTAYDLNQSLSLVGTFPAGTSLKVKLRGQAGAAISYEAFKTGCWNVTVFDYAAQKMEASVASTATAQTCDLHLIMMSLQSGSATPVDVGPGAPCIAVEYYENFELTGTSSPTKIKTVCQNGASGDGQPDAGITTTPHDAATEPSLPDLGISASEVATTSDAPVAPDRDAAPSNDVIPGATPDLGNAAAIDGATFSNPCLGGRMLCDGTCVDVSTSMQNCGACGKVCGGSEQCIAGQCGCPSGISLTHCGTACVSTQYDTNNCGACGNACSSPQICSQGVCTL
jgi:hypothetical protein